MNAATTEGVRCLYCTQGRHATAAEVRACWADREDAMAEAAAESAAEQAYERHLEDAGWQEAALQDEMEMRRSVIPFSDAMRQAEQAQPYVMSGVGQAEQADSATAKQRDYVVALLAAVEISPEARATYEANLPTLTKRQASEWIAALKALPRTAKAPQSGSNVPDVPAGHYAVPSRTGNNDLDFFRVDRPTEGRWADRTFVKRVIGGHPDQPVRGGEAKVALEAIAKTGVGEAARKYGQEIGRCCMCNRSLTDETSRALGIGPDCRQRTDASAFVMQNEVDCGCRGINEMCSRHSAEYQRKYGRAANE